MRCYTLPRYNMTFFRIFHLIFTFSVSISRSWEAGTLPQDALMLIRIDNLNKYDYTYSIDWRIKKAGHVDPPRFKSRVVRSRNVLTAKQVLLTLGTRMTAVKLYRRFSLRRSIYILCIPQPVDLTQPVRIRERGPPAT